jgi:hypothetical protein
MGFVYSIRPSSGWEKTKLALETYKRLCGDLLVPATFVVPMDDSNWPKEIWGMNLGVSVTNIRCKVCFRGHRKELVAMGFDYSPQRNKFGWEQVKLVLETYKELHGDLLVPIAFAVPINDSAWPEEMWGMSLGTFVSTVRQGKSYVDYRKELLTMGFDYSFQIQQHGWDMMKLALEK